MHHLDVLRMKMKTLLNLFSIFIFVQVAHTEPSALLFESMVEAHSQASGEKIEIKMEEVPESLRSILEVTKEEKAKLEAGESLYTHKEFRDLLRKASEANTALPKIAVILVNQGIKNKLNGVQLTLACRLIIHETERQNQAE